jgi:hypothetical protein
MKVPLLIVCSLVIVGCTKRAPEQETTRENRNGTDQPLIADVPENYKPFYNHSIRTDEDIEAFRARLPFDSISLTRTECYGTCPVYDVVLHRDGTAEFNAKEHLPKLGKFTGQIGLGIYARLCYLIESSRFDDLKPAYRGGWSDDTTCFVTVTKGNTKKAVSDYGTVGPIELWAIQEIIDRIKDRADWKPLP